MERLVPTRGQDTNRNGGGTEIETIEHVEIVPGFFRTTSACPLLSREAREATGPRQIIEPVQQWRPGSRRPGACCSQAWLRSRR
jgi:hypothetical protein